LVWQRHTPGIGKKKVAAVIAKRPFGTLEEFRRLAGTTPLDHLIAL
jgi:DNA uptake protein ComE-like DNA-binding protein